MNAEKFMPDASRQQRISVLQDTAAKTEVTNYIKPLSQEELDGMRENLAENFIKLNDLEEDKREVNADFKRKMDPISQANKILLSDIKTKQTTVLGTLYHLADYDNSMMVTYDESGEFISSRRLKPDEKQGGLFTMRPAANQ